MDLQALADFNLVAAYGGFGKASRASGRAKATLSRRVAELEQTLGVRLIERGSRLLRLTEEGQTLHQRTTGPLSEIVEAGEALVSGAPIPRGRLRISAPVVFAHVALSRIAADFARTYPEVQLEIIAEDRKVDPIEEGYDLVIRIDPSEDEHLVGRCFLKDERLLVTAPGMKCPWPQEPGETSMQAVLLTTTPPTVQWRLTCGSGRDYLIHPRPSLRFSSLLMIRDAVLAGAGAALLPRLLVSDDLTSGRLVQWATHVGPDVEIWALHSSRRLTGAKVRAFVGMMEAAFPEKNSPRPTG
ncbi:LysR substrate-binding domain-containing protein [Acetobacter conturbans]|uniref:LysR family transcriptional regulator n=1 Tax=Acetobacter conturbans TaxID=1737472 RepID=A0ABX0K1C4_9PROT|nr:LysR substrate-binding domain-containing protein [Acetobacter conturbans]NHN89536.1 LysR family transcriptional regulator [Acetobacter conturbans]